jgi:hypothetical protein
MEDAKRSRASQTPRKAVAKRRRGINPAEKNNAAWKRPYRKLNLAYWKIEREERNYPEPAEPENSVAAVTMTGRGSNPFSRERQQAALAA